MVQSKIICERTTKFSFRVSKCQKSVDITKELTAVVVIFTREMRMMLKFLRCQELASLYEAV